MRAPAVPAKKKMRKVVDTMQYRNYSCVAAMTSTPQAHLRDAIFRSGRPQIEVARRAGIHESRLSKIVRGWLTPNEDEMAALAKVLRTTVEALFPTTSRKAS